MHRAERTTTMGLDRSSVRSVARLALLLGAQLVGACVEIDDPEHCANREGDATCRQIYGAHAICDACDHFHHGCVDDEPPQECRVDASEDSSGEGDASSSDDGGSSGEDVTVDCDGCPSVDAGEGVR